MHATLSLVPPLVSSPKPPWVDSDRPRPSVQRDAAELAQGLYPKGRRGSNRSTDVSGELPGWSMPRQVRGSRTGEWHG